MSTKNGVPFRQNLVSPSKHRIKAPYTMKPKKVTLHETDNQATAEAEINYMISNNLQVSYHVATDEKESVQGIPFNRNAWHAGDGGNGYGNRNTVAYEICRNYDRNRNTANLQEPLRSQYNKAVDNTVKVVAWDMLNELDITATIDNIKTHNDWNGKWCPRQILNSGNLPDIKARIIAEYVRLKGGGGSVPSAPSNPGTYTVKAGDTLWGIANKYGVSVPNLRSWNNISGDLIRVGQTLRLTSGGSTSTPAPSNNQSSSNQLTVDGAWGPKTTRRLQQVLGTVVDGIISGQSRNDVTRNISSVQFGSGGSMMVREMQRRLKVTVDGLLGPQTIRALQRRYGTPVTGGVSRTNSTVVKAMQRSLNQGRF